MANQLMLVLYEGNQSSSKQILSIVDDVKQVLKSNPLINEDYTVRFADFSASSLNILIIFFVNSNDYDVMIEVKEQVNVKIIEIVEQHHCDFAYPTQTLFIKNKE